MGRAAGNPPLDPRLPYGLYEGDTDRADRVAARLGVTRAQFVRDTIRAALDDHLGWEEWETEEPTAVDG